MRLLSKKQVAEKMDCSWRTIHRLRDMGKICPPVRVGSLVKWRESDIDQWILAGCPDVARTGWTPPVAGGRYEGKGVQS